MTDGIDREWIWGEFRRILQALALPSADQAAVFPDFVLLGDELAILFDDWHRAVSPHYRNQLEPAAQTLEALRAQFAHMEALHNIDLWSDEGVEQRSEWAIIRQLAAAALAQLNWPVANPGSYARQYVGGARKPWWKPW